MCYEVFPLLDISTGHWSHHLWHQTRASPTLTTTNNYLDLDSTLSQSWNELFIFQRAEKSHSKSKSFRIESLNFYFDLEFWIEHSTLDFYLELDCDNNSFVHSNVFNILVSWIFSPYWSQTWGDKISQNLNMESMNQNAEHYQI